MKSYSNSFPSFRTRVNTIFYIRLLGFVKKVTSCPQISYLSVLVTLLVAGTQYLTPTKQEERFILVHVLVLGRLASKKKQHGRGAWWRKAAHLMPTKKPRLKGGAGEGDKPVQATFPGTASSDKVHSPNSEPAVASQ